MRTLVHAKPGRTGVRFEFQREEVHIFFSIPKIDPEKKMKVTVLVDFLEGVCNEVQ